MRASRETVGEAVSSLLIHLRCLRPSAQVQPLILPVRFSLMRLIASRASRFDTINVHIV